MVAKDARHSWIDIVEKHCKAGDSSKSLQGLQGCPDSRQFSNSFLERFHVCRFGIFASHLMEKISLTNPSASDNLLIVIAELF